MTQRAPHQGQMQTITIRPLLTMAEIKPLEEIQMRAWGRNPRQIIPAHVLKAAQFNGAVVLGAFAGDEVIGYAYGIIGTLPQQEQRPRPITLENLHLYSHQLAVLPAYQSQGIGRQLKLAQREWARARGLKIITWTYDPLMSRNGWLNIGRLGGIVQRYLTDFYGDLDTAMSDRFYLEWWIDSNRVVQRVERQRRPLSFDSLIGGGAHLLNPATINPVGLLQPSFEIERPQGLTALVEIPANFSALISQDYALGLQWRTHTRTAFTELFAQNFIVTDFIRQVDESGLERCYYLLTHQEAGRVFA